MKAVQERMETKMDTNQEKIDNGQEEMKGQMDSLASWINANQQQISQDGCLERSQPQWR
jgi:hypothetical protein